MGAAVQRAAGRARRGSGGDLPPAAGGPEGRAARALSQAGGPHGGPVREPASGSEARLLSAVARDDFVEALHFGGTLVVIEVLPFALGIDSRHAGAGLVVRLRLPRTAAVVRLQRGILRVLFLLLLRFRRRDLLLAFLEDLVLAGRGGQRGGRCGVGHGYRHRRVHRNQLLALGALQDLVDGDVRGRGLVAAHLAAILAAPHP